MRRSKRRGVRFTTASSVISTFYLVPFCQTTTNRGLFGGIEMNRPRDDGNRCVRRGVKRPESSSSARQFTALNRRNRQHGASKQVSSSCKSKIQGTEGLKCDGQRGQAPNNDARPRLGLASQPVPTAPTNMAEEYSPLNGTKSSGLFSKAVGVGSLLALIAAVIIGIVISTQVSKLPKATKSLLVDLPIVNAHWEVRTPPFPHCHEPLYSFLC